MAQGTDVLIIGAGIIGSAIAYFAAQQGLSVVVLDRAGPASGTSSRCEGNILLSDKELGPELELSQYSLGVWKNDLAEFAHLWEFEAKGGLVVASQESSQASLDRLTTAQRTNGVVAEILDRDQLLSAEPHISPDALSAAYYPQDSQVQPMLAASWLLRLACDAGAKFVPNAQVTALRRSNGRVIGVDSTAGAFAAGNIVNATGTWASSIAGLAEVAVPVNPRKGFVMVTEPLPPKVFHKVYAAEYVDNVGSSDAGLQSSPVVEGTPAGSILIGSSRERVGFDGSVNLSALKQMANNAIGLFPFLRDVKIMRHYHGFRPYCPDHLPVIGHDGRAPGLWHAAGHEGAGIGLSVGTGKLLAQALAGQTADLDLAPFAPHRFAEHPLVKQES